MKNEAIIAIYAQSISFLCLFVSKSIESNEMNRSRIDCCWSAFKNESDIISFVLLFVFGRRKSWKFKTINTCPFRFVPVLSVFFGAFSTSPAFDVQSILSNDISYSSVTARSSSSAMCAIWIFQTSLFHLICARRDFLLDVFHKFCVFDFFLRLILFLLILYIVWCVRFFLSFRVFLFALSTAHRYDFSMLSVAEVFLYQLLPSSCCFFTLPLPLSLSAHFLWCWNYTLSLRGFTCVLFARGKTGPTATKREKN